MGTGHGVPPEIVSRLSAICTALPEVEEEAAWTGVRWTVRRKNFAHVVRIDQGHPPAYAKAAGTAGPATVLTFRATGPRLASTRFAKPPFFRPAWFPDIAGVHLGNGIDWDEVAELLTESYCLLAPKKLVEQVG